jgi:hypothetical protein
MKVNRSFRFYKDGSGDWYIDLPEWDGEISDLQMVAGADSFCNILAQGDNEVYVHLSNEPFQDCQTLLYQMPGRLEGWEMGSGAWYMLEYYMGNEFNLPMWLCDVTKFVFGDFPNIIFFK